MSQRLFRLPLTPAQTDHLGSVCGIDRTELVLPWPRLVALGLLSQARGSEGLVHAGEALGQRLPMSSVVSPCVRLTLTTDQTEALADVVGFAPRWIDVAPEDDPIIFREHWNAEPPVRLGRFTLAQAGGAPLSDPDVIQWPTLGEGCAVFGTGKHPTTILAETLMERHMKAGARVLDFGCGSGVLSVVAVRLGASVVAAIDIEPEALEMTRRLAEANGVSGQVHIEGTDLDALDHQWDFVIANVFARILVQVADALAARTAPGGLVVLSGIATGRADAVAAHYVSLGFTLVDSVEDPVEEWRGLCLRRLA